MNADLTGKSILFVTGSLAEASLRDVVTPIAAKHGFQFEIVVPGIQVAALLHVNLLRKRLTVAPHVDLVVVPGWCQGSLDELTQQFGKPFVAGPKDLYDLPEFFGVGKRRTADLSRYSIQILAEINHATRMPLKDIIAEASRFRSSGADMIDVGGVAGESSPRIGEIVRVLNEEGHRVSVDSFDRDEVTAAVSAGAELILSCNHSNLNWVSQMGVEVVAVPDTPQDLESLDRLIESLTDLKVPFRIDPILEPIGMGFTASLQRYMDVRKKYPVLPMMMGIGNVTELTEVDSAGVNMILAAICEELGIQSVLTTQVINWCRSAVAEFNSARRLVHHAISTGTLPKHVDSSLVILRDSRLHGKSSEALTSLADALTDANFRIFAEQNELHLMNRHGHWHGTDPFAIMSQAMDAQLAAEQPIDASHAFYLGYELARAQVALHLGKQYTQDAPLPFGLLGSIEPSKHV